MDRGNRDKLSPLSVLYRALLYGAVGFAVAVAQTTLFADLGVFSVVPDVTLAFVVALSLFEGEKSGAVAGVALGFTVDALGAASFSLSPLLYMLAGATCGVLSAKTPKKNYLSFLVFMGLAAAAHAVTSLIETAFVLDSFTLPSLLVGLILPEIICTLLFCSVAYPLAKLCNFISEKIQAMKRSSRGQQF